MTVDSSSALSAGPSAVPAAGLEFLSGGGEMGLRMRTLDWSRTPLGEPRTWPQSLKTIVRVILDSRYAMWMLWGPELTFFCNDAYLPTVGIKRDWVLGARSDKVWEEIWPDIGPRIRQVLATGEATWDEGLLLFLERSGFTEETYHTFSYSPVYDDGNRIAGMLCVVTEVTERVVGERRLRTLRDLAASLGGVESVQEACDRLVAGAAQDPLDLPFLCVYTLEQAEQRLRLRAFHGNLPDALRPADIRLADGAAPWPIPAAIREGSPRLVELPTAEHAVYAPLWPDRIGRAIVLPVTGQGSSDAGAVILIGLSPRRALDEGYWGFFELIGRQFAAALADARAYESARARAEALAEIDRAKTAFFSNVSHEFRTPLTLLLGPLEETLSDSRLPPSAKDPLNLARRNALRLLKLVNSLLDFARIEAGRAQAAYEPVDLARLTGDLASLFRSAIARAALEFEVDCPPLQQPVYVDREMWETIVLNLLSNALKFTFRGSIVVRLRSDDSSAILQITDTGVGIPPQEMPRLFERFHRVESTRGRTHEGSGIGLALVHELVKQHGGTVGAESLNGVGTTFLVRLPFGKAHLPAERVVAGGAGAPPGQRADSFVEEALGWLPDGESGAAENPGLAEAPAPAGNPGLEEGADSPPLVLLADDNADMRRYVRRLLETRYEVIAVNDGEAALRAARERTPDLVLSDVMMPILDGFALVRALRADPELQSVPVILLSARAGEEATVEGLSAGADGYLSKPFSARELLARVGGAIALAKARRESHEQLRRADRQKDEFLAMLAHELRNPLAPIGNAVDVLARLVPGDSRVQDSLAMAKRQVAQLRRLVDDLLDVARLTQGRIDLKRRPVRVSDVIGQALETVEPVLRERGHQVSIESSAPHPPVVDGDAARLVQCVVNVLVNSIKYSDAGGSISVRIESCGSDAIIEISDAGVGIAPDLLPHVFDLFVQGHRTLDRSQGGLGVGLVVVKRLIEMHGGTVTARSAGIGHGTTIEIRLPQVAAPPKAASQVPKDKIVSKIRILVVDDNRDAADSLTLLLEIGGHEVTAAYSAQEALQRAAELQPAVILLDIGLPEIDGYEVARRMRGMPELRSVRLIALTGYGQDEDRQRTRNAGFDHHLVKPVDLDELERTLTA